MKLLACAHPTNEHKFGNWFECSDSEAEAYLAMYSSGHKCYELMKDLGPDSPAAPAAETPAEDAPAETPADEANDAPVAEESAEAATVTSKKRSAKAAE